MKKVLFIDRDGTLIIEPDTDYQVDALHKFRFLPGVIKYLTKIYDELDYELVLVTNQDGLGTDSFPEHTFWPLQDLMMNTFKDEGVRFANVFIDRHFEKDNSPFRKPGTAMLQSYIDGDYDLGGSFVIGDRWTDIILAKNLGAKGIFINQGSTDQISVPTGMEAYLAQVADCWSKIYTFLKTQKRLASVKRVTKETAIEISVNLDGSGISSISTGLYFFDHMLDQLARHGDVDLVINATGDLHIDEHHTVEDTAITLGKAFKRAMAKKIGINRYGFALPMDDCLAQVAIDFGGRAWLVWDASFQREKIGDVPTELFYHFFKSFSDHAECNINIMVQGENEHHKIESIFKAFAKSIKMAVQRDVTSDLLPSTKGII